MSKNSYNLRTVSVGLVIVLLSGCGGGETRGTPAKSGVGDDWFSALSPGEVATIRRTFPDFQPELFARGTDPTNRLGLRPSNFLPARIFGEAIPTATQVTPRGVILQSSGYDTSRLPIQLAPSGTYFDPQHVPFELQLGSVQVAPLHKLEERMNLPLTPLPPLVSYDRRDWHVRPEEIDRILLEVRSALALRLPSVADVDLQNCEVAIQPTIFYVQGSNFGDTWAGGSTQKLSNGKYRLQMSVFYINSQRLVTDWRLYLIDEAINYYVLSIGREDLAL